LRRARPRTYLTGDDARQISRAPADHIEADQLPDFSSENAHVSAGVDERKITN
jgi:hypothetical protein